MLLVVTEVCNGAQGGVLHFNESHLSATAPNTPHAYNLRLSIAVRHRRTVRSGQV